MAKLMLLFVVLSIVASSGFIVVAETLPEYPDKDNTSPIIYKNKENAELGTYSEFENKNLPQNSVSHISDSNKSSRQANSESFKEISGQVSKDGKNKEQSIKPPETASHRRIQTGSARKLGTKRNSVPKQRTVAAVNSSKKNKTATTLNNERLGRSKSPISSKSKTTQRKTPSGKSTKESNANEHTTVKVFNQELLSEGINAESSISNAPFTVTTLLEKNKGLNSSSYQEQSKNHDISSLKTEERVNSDVGNNFEKKETVHAVAIDGNINPTFPTKVESDGKTTSAFEFSPETKFTSNPKEKSQNSQTSYSSTEPIKQSNVEYKDSVAFGNSLGTDSNKSLDLSNKHFNMDSKNQDKVAADMNFNFDSQLTGEQIFKSIPAPSKGSFVKENSETDKTNTEFENPSNRKFLDTNYDAKNSFNKESNSNVYEENTRKETELFKMVTNSYPNISDVKITEEDKDSIVPNTSVFNSEENFRKNENKAKKVEEEINLQLMTESKQRAKSVFTSKMSDSKSASQVNETNKDLIPDILDKPNEGINLDTSSMNIKGQFETDLKKSFELSPEKPVNTLGFHDNGNVSSHDEQSIEQSNKYNPLSNFSSELKEKSQSFLLSHSIPKTKLKYSLLTGQFFVYGSSADFDFGKLLEEIILAGKENRTRIDTNTFLKSPKEKYTVGKFTLAFASSKNNETDKKTEDLSKHQLEIREDQFPEITDLSWLLSTITAESNSSADDGDTDKGKLNYNMDSKIPAKEFQIKSGSEDKSLVSSENPEVEMVYAEDITNPAKILDKNSVSNFTLKSKEKPDYLKPLELSANPKELRSLEIDHPALLGSSRNLNLPPNENKEDGPTVGTNNPTFDINTPAKSEFSETDPKTTEEKKYVKNRKEELESSLNDKIVLTDKAENNTDAETKLENSFKNKDINNIHEPLAETFHDAIEDQNKAKLSTYAVLDHGKSTKELLPGSSEIKKTEEYSGELYNQKLPDENDSHPKFSGIKNEWDSNKDSNKYNENTASNIGTQSNNMKSNYAISEGQIKSDSKLSLKKNDDTLNFDVNANPGLYKEGYENEKTTGFSEPNPVAHFTSESENESQNFEPSESTTELSEYEDFTTFDDNTVSSTDKSLDDYFYQDEQNEPSEETETHPKLNENNNYEKVSSALSNIDETVNIKQFNKNDKTGNIEERSRNKPFINNYFKTNNPIMHDTGTSEESVEQANVPFPVKFTGEHKQESQPYVTRDSRKTFSQRREASGAGSSTSSKIVGSVRNKDQKPSGIHLSNRRQD